VCSVCRFFCIVLYDVFLFECGVICALCLIVVPLPLSKNPFAVKINDSKKKILDVVIVNCRKY
jgi:hypothetical protein